MNRLFTETGRAVVGFVEGAGYTLVLLFAALAHTPSLFRRTPEVIGHMFTYGVRTFPVTAVVGVFFGGIFTLQIAVELKAYGQLDIVPLVITAGMCREMGPFITAIVLIATVGSGMAAEIGTMRVSEEVDALEVMAIDPVRYLIAPRLIALIIVCPLLTVVVDFLGVTGGMLVATTNFGITGESFRDQAIDVLRYYRTVFELPKDLYTGLIKSFVFGITIGAIGLSSGMRAAGGAIGVGHCVRQAVINCLVVIITFSYFLSWFFSS